MGSFLVAIALLKSASALPQVVNQSCLDSKNAGSCRGTGPGDTGSLFNFIHTSPIFCVATADG